MAQNKRPRESDRSASDVRDVVGEVHRAITTKQRLAVFRHLRVLLGCESTVAWNEQLPASPQTAARLIEAGLVQALSLQLHFVVQQHGSTTHERIETCQIIDILLRLCHDDDVKERCVSGLGPDFFHLMADMLAAAITAPVLSIFHSTAKNFSVAMMIVKSRKIMSHIVETLLDSSEILDESMLIDLLGCLLNLATHVSDRRKVLLHHPDLLYALSMTTLRPSCGSDEVALLVASVLRKFCEALDCREVLVGHPDVLNAMVRLCDRSHPKILYHVLEIFLCVAMDQESCLPLIFHEDGILVTLLTKLMMESPHPSVRWRAARAFRLLANDPTAPMLVHDSRLMTGLSTLALQDRDERVRNEAAEAFARCASLVQAGQPHYQGVLDALTKLAISPSIAPHVLARALKDQASHRTNRGPMVERAVLVESLARIGNSVEATAGTKGDVCCALLYLASEEVNRERLATTSILDTLVSNANADHLDIWDRRESAIKAILQLAVSPLNQQKMAKHGSLLQTLIQFVSSIADTELKREVKGVILVLVNAM